jgi:ABC-type uncharacterized transport system permease subunit
MRQLIKPMLALAGSLMTTPLGLLAAVALGPVILGVLCAVVFGLVVFAGWSVLVGLAMLSRRAYLGFRGGPPRASASTVELRREV